MTWWDGVKSPICTAKWAMAFFLGITVTLRTARVIDGIKNILGIAVGSAI